MGAGNLAVVYLGLGSNRGDRKGNLTRALEELKRCGVALETVSSVYETDPVGGLTQEKFLNTVVKGQTQLFPLPLLKVCQMIEGRLGRMKSMRNGPRTLDIDILLYGRISYFSFELTIPHPRMLKRDFVMTPFKEIDTPLVQELFGCAS